MGKKKVFTGLLALVLILAVLFSSMTVTYAAGKPDAPVVSADTNEASGKPVLTWDTVDGAEEYQIYRATSKSGSYKKIYTASGTKFTNTSATVGKTYYYKVRAVDEDGNKGAYSAVKSVTCACARPEVTAGIKSSNGKPRLTWKTVEGASKYEVYRATSENGTYKKTYTTSGTSYTNTSAVAGKTYYYKVKAICSAKSSGNSAYSEVRSVTCGSAAVEEEILGTAVCTAKEWMNLRSGPASTYSKSGQFNAGQKADIYEIQGKWYKLLIDGEYHWAYEDYLDVTLKNASGGGADDGGADDGGAADEEPIGTAVCTASKSVNLRKGPGTGYSKSGTFKAGQKADVYEEQNNWYKLLVDGKYHWASGDYLNVTLKNASDGGTEGGGTEGGGTEGGGTEGGGTEGGDTEGGDTEGGGTEGGGTEGGGTEEEILGTAVCIASKSVNLRIGPASSYEKSGTFKAGQKADVYEEQNNWYKLKIDGVYHWASGDYLNVTLNINDKYTEFPIAANNKLAGKVVILDPGHGGSGGGAYADYTEHVYNLIHAKLIKESLENCGATVIMTRSTNVSVNNYARVSMANKYTLELMKKYKQSDLERAEDSAAKEALETEIAEIDRLIGVMQSVIDNPSLADTYYLSPYDQAVGRAVHSDLKKIFEYQKDPRLDHVIYVSIHSNATGSGDTSVNGTVTFYMDNSYNSKYYTGYQTAKNKLLATEICDEVVAAGGFAKRGVKVNDYFMVREVNIPSALLEIGFHTNAKDRAKLMDPVIQKRVANAVTYAIMDYFG